jgi:hypothetical protein
VAILLIGIGGFGFWFYQKHRGKIAAPSISSSNPANPAPMVPVMAGESPAETASAPPATTATTTAPKSIDDFKIGPIALEKGKGTGLVYAVGVLRNGSEHQRFGIKLELELSDANGNKVGTAKDYRAVLEPRQEWRFRALILDNRATSARLASVEEDQ